MRQRRVGTVTLGGILVLYGIIFLIKTFADVISYYQIFELWPVIFVMLGIEILFASIRWKEQEFKYDFGAIIIIFLLSIFAMGMAGMDYLYTHTNALEYWYW